MALMSAAFLICIGGVIRDGGYHLVPVPLLIYSWLEFWYGFVVETAVFLPYHLNKSDLHENSSVPFHIELLAAAHSVAMYHVC